jgi:hypothetical protein
MPFSAFSTIKLPQCSPHGNLRQCRVYRSAARHRPLADVDAAWNVARAQPTRHLTRSGSTLVSLIE